ncbi:SAM-dependent methyltransferase [Legionella cincinnatiensis]|uniref:Exported protein n=1 Tax=Legionella cincinnatiensis TaxID=28085 RepID=A0A378IMI5_9GAMM|nr:class I SAM-dependent methyltransferase [Legionella cincinnatiensis]KTC85277.1 Methyltransferase domain protein [Legionella cincinnatiensis]STX36359.1 Exported protein [Legionella cincinnatiensis]
MSVAISHQTVSHVPYDETTKQLVASTKSRLEKSDHLFLPLHETLELLNELASFSLGRFLLHNRGLNGYWTSYIFRNNPDQEQAIELESWLLNKSLYVMARERFYTFQEEIRKRLKSNMTLASIPSGLMDDLLFLDYSSYHNIHLVGIDADSESLNFARQNAHEQGFSNEQITLMQKDAWDLAIESEFDLLTSNGLNMYESCEKRLVALYQSFYKALKPEGTLVISFIPPPPQNVESLISPENFLKERAIFGDIVQINYLNFCTEENMKIQLQAAGFTIESIQYNEKGMAPVVVAKK